MSTTQVASSAVLWEPHDCTRPGSGVAPRAVRDLALEEPTIEEIVRRIYRRDVA